MLEETQDILSLIESALCEIILIMLEVFCIFHLTPDILANYSLNQSVFADLEAEKLQDGFIFPNVF